MTGSTGGSPHRGRPNDTVRGLIGGEVVADWVEGTSSIFRAALPITALYLTGSICLGAFNPALSDLDLSVITNQTVDEVGLGEVAGLLEGHGPPPAHGGLDVELFDAADARDPSMPLRWHGTIRWRRDVGRPEVHAASPYGALDWAPSLELTRR
ncbi:MAG TPA: nucleotidyltransferase domain-containing protein, partial [Acidimicrobiales bacterium]|nr:nucleotidyltransferase domain-containing protein [Acidimicrobiales bacterium]